MNPGDLLLPSLAGIDHNVARLADLEVGGRIMMTFARGHMAEVRADGDVVAYFRRFYDRVGLEFMQFDEYDFVVHHCARQQYWHWAEEMALLRTGPLGGALTTIGAPLPELGPPTSPQRRPPIAQSWYGEVYEALESGTTPTPRGTANEIVPPAQRSIRDADQVDRMWCQFLIWCGETWGRQVVVMWDILRLTIAMRRAAESMPAEAVAAVVERDTATWHDAATSLNRRYAEWRGLHAGTVDVHDPLFDANLADITTWTQGVAPDVSQWTIKDAAKHEMYLELAATMLSLRGTPTTARVGPFRYWRQGPYTPSSHHPGAIGMPPFTD